MRAMKNIMYAVQLSLLMMIIFGGTFIFQYLVNDHLRWDQLIGVGIGALIFCVAILVAKVKQREQSVRK